MLLPLLLAACACHRAPEVAASEPPNPPVAEAVAQPEPAPCCRGLPLPSSWSSPACEGRAYERRFRFSEGRFEAKDLVAPCPPGTLCVWSGILDRAGTWTYERREIRLVPEPDPRGGPPVQPTQYPLPDRLWLGEDGTLTEDEGHCPYQRVE